MSRLGPHQIVEQHCHNPSCSLFNRAQEFCWALDCWEHPAEWVDEPECRECWGETHAEPLDVQRVIDDVARDFNDDWMDWSEADRQYFRAALAYQDALAGRHPKGA